MVSTDFQPIASAGRLRRKTLKHLLFLWISTQNVHNVWDNPLRRGINAFFKSYGSKVIRCHWIMTIRSTKKVKPLWQMSKDSFRGKYLFFTVKEKTSSVIRIRSGSVVIFVWGNCFLFSQENNKKKTSNEFLLMTGRSNRLQGAKKTGGEDRLHTSSMTKKGIRSVDD